MLLSSAFVWILAAGFNPRLTSGEVWLIGLIVGFIVWTIKFPEYEKSWEDEFGS